MFYILIAMYDGFNFSTSSPTVLSCFAFDSHPWVFPGGSVVKTLPANAEDAGDLGCWIPGSGKFLEEEIATNSSIAWKFPWTEEPGRLKSMQLQRVGRHWAHMHNQPRGYETVVSLWSWMVCLGNEQRAFCRFWDCIQVLHFGLFHWLWWLLHFF